jgi:hypothetical protein
MAVVRRPCDYGFLCFASPHPTGLTMRCSEPGHHALVAIRASRARVAELGSLRTATPYLTTDDPQQARFSAPDAGEEKF